jgi:hypothetical protein
MQIPSSIVPTQDITNTKFVAIAMVLGLRLQKPGIYVTFDKEHPREWVRCPNCGEKLHATGGQGHFLFETNLSNSVRNYLQIFDAGTADVDLNEYLETLDIPPAKLEELEKKIAEGLITYGRQFLDQYQVMVRYVKDEVNQFVVTEGEPVYSKSGQIVGKQDFTITQLPRSK